MQRMVQKILRMPLHAKDRVFGVFDGLDYMVAVVSADTQLLTESVNGLVVEGVGFEAVATKEIVESCVWQNLDFF